MTADESIGIGRIANNKNLDCLLGIFVKSLALNLENLDVGGQQVLPLHPLPARHGPHQEGRVDVGEGLGHVIRGHHTGDQGKGRVLYLHADAVQDTHHWSNVQQMEIQGLVIAKHNSTGQLRTEIIH